MPAPEGLDFGDDDEVLVADDTDLDIDGEQLGVSDDDGDVGEVSKKYVNLDEVADHYMVIDGEEVLVSDLPSGFMKAKDYTQKTQRLAADSQAVAWANALQAALHEDPNGTLDVLRNAWGASPQEPVSDDPRDRDIQELKSWRAQSQAEMVRNQIATEVRTLTEQYGEDLDLAEASQLAQSRRITLTDAAEILDGRKARADRAKAATNAARTDLKRNDAVVSTGGSRRAVEPGPQHYKTLKEATEAALKTALSKGFS